ncbi:MAG: hypothetical protein IT322_05400 [Anaerolineae bacterium]|nr:hypothetical protein [Anaerolineae bacterium]
MSDNNYKQYVDKLLQRIGLYQSFKRWRRILRDPLYRLNLAEVAVDYASTRAAIGGFMAQGAERADPQKGLLIVSFSNNPANLKVHALLGKILQLEGYTPIILTSKRFRNVGRYCKLFGITKVLYWEDLIRRFSPPLQQVNQIVDDLLAGTINPMVLKDWHLDGVFVGRHALSTATRFRLTAYFDLNDPETRQMLYEHLIKAVQSKFVAENIFQHYPIQKQFVVNAGYTPQGALLEVGLQRGIDTIRFGGTMRRGSVTFKRYYPNQASRLHPISLSPETWQKVRDIALTPEQETALQADFDGRYDPHSNYHLHRYQEGKHDFDSESLRKLLHLDPHKKTAVIFSHISWDSSFFEGVDLYDSYEHWLVETTRLACQNPHLNWIVKLHPANLVKLDMDAGGVRETEMRALEQFTPLPPHVQIMRADTPVNTHSLFPAMDYGLTVRGTIGMELPCLGIQSLTAGTGRYNGYGFTLDSATRGEYEERVRTLQNQPPVTDHQRELARRHAYWTFIRRQTLFNDLIDIAVRSNAEVKNDLQYQITILAKSIEMIETHPSVRALAHWVIDEDTPDLIV